MGLFDKRRRRGGLDGLVDDFGASLGAGLGTALGSALNSAIKPAVNNIGNSVATSIKDNASTATQSMVSIAESQKKIANKKETTSFEYYDVCPYCGAPRDGDRDACEYCGTSLVKATQTKIE